MEIIYFFAFILLAAFLFFAIAFLIAQQNILKAIQPQNRLMQPGEVWLQLIPLFNVYWQFVTVNRIADSIQNELSSNTFTFEDASPDAQIYSTDIRPTHSIGMAYCILGLCGFIPVLGIIATIASLVCRVIYWIKLAEYKKQIEQKNYAVVAEPSFT